MCDQLVALFDPICAESFAGLCGARDDENLPPRPFRRGDLDGNEKVDLADAMRVLEGLFRGKIENLRCADAANANDDGRINLGDAICVAGLPFRERQPAGRAVPRSRARSHGRRDRVRVSL